ncbi:MAG TPA: universal stress protein [Caldilineaceae bacterium]|nr:universal stress protein [Caldilineaceae bacterium]
MNAIYRKIVVPMDGSPLAEEILPHLQRMALPAQSEVHLVGVLEAWRYAMGTPDLAMIDLVQYLRDDLQNYLAQQQETLQKQGYRVTIHCRDGDAALTIIDVANAIHADLIAMTTHGRSGVRRWTLGSVAERVLHEAEQPLLIVRHETVSTDTLKYLLVPLDGSAMSEEALAHATNIAQATGATLLLLHVVQAIDPTNQRLLFQSKAEAESAVHEWMDEGQRYLDGVGQRVAKQGIRCETRVRLGDPDRVICATTIDAGIDLVVMSTHGRTGVRRWIYGSVANKVLRGLDCPLLLVRSAADGETLEEPSERSFHAN